MGIDDLPRRLGKYYMDMPREDDEAHERGLTVDDLPDYMHSATSICDACTPLAVEAMITKDDTFQSRPLVHLGNYTGWTPVTR